MGAVWLGDVILARAPTGVPASLVMGAVVALLARATVTRWRRLGARRLIVPLTLAAAALALARVYLVWAHLQAPDPAARTAARAYDIVFALFSAGAAAIIQAGPRARSLTVAIVRRPAVLLATSFIALIAVGTLLLSLPLSVVRVADLSLADALFTITSAVCVTGLAVNDIGRTYTAFGQGVILAGVQLGGMGIMTIAALALTARREAAVAAQAQYAQALDVRAVGDLRGLVRSVVITTLIIEALGTLLLLALVSGDARLGGRSALWFAVFHAVSAFCSAGLALRSDNLTAFVSAPGVQLVITALALLGGLGFPVLRELARRAIARIRADQRPAWRLSLASRTVLVVSALLVAGGTAAIAILESGGVLVQLPPLERVLAAFFTSVTTRSAGFNTVDVAAMQDATLVVLMALMFIGGSPASTAGGIKTTTFAVIVAALRAELRGREPELGGRALSSELLRRATAVAAISLLVILTSVLLLCMLERQPFMRLVFEAVAAFSTAGMSTGVTPELGVAARLVLVVTMFVGRVGPLTVALAVGETTARRGYRLPREDLPVG